MRTELGSVAYTHRVRKDAGPCASKRKRSSISLGTIGNDGCDEKMLTSANIDASPPTGKDDSWRHCRSAAHPPIINTDKPIRAALRPTALRIVSDTRKRSPMVQSST